MQFRSSTFRLIASSAMIASPLAFVAAQRAEKTSDFKWSGQIARCRWVKIRDINGTVTVGQASGDRVEVTAVKRWERGNPDDVRIEARKDGDDIVVCALWGTRSTCDDQSYRGRHGDDRTNNDDDVQVDFTVLMPRGTKLRSATVNGGVTVTGATSDVDVATVNGSIHAETGAGPVSAASVNGPVYVRVTGDNAGSPMSFTTVNGNVIAELPANLGADVTMTTVNGGLESDYPMTMSGRIDPHHLSVHVGAPGGPRIILTTVNGGVQLRKR